MSVNSRFAIAVHILTYMALEADRQPLSSNAIAYSVNTNPVIIRRVLSVLTRAGLVATQLGVEGGATLTRSPEQITLLDVYQGIELGHLFALHRRPPNPHCLCGRNIQPILTTAFKQAETAMEASLDETTIADLVRAIKARQQAEYL